MKRLVVISDLHCGHRSGLTPPSKRSADDYGFLGKVADFQRELWNWYVREIESLKPIDTLVCNGDAIDGKGYKSGGNEQIEIDRHEQVKMAAECIEVAQAKKIFIINGTPYHTGSEEDWEMVLADKLEAEYANHEFVESAGVKFDFKHKVGSSTVPHGRWTPARKSALWNSLQAEKGVQPLADFIIRSHVHYYTVSEDYSRTAITTPALQGWSKYGSRECEGTNDVGFLSFDCDEGIAEMTTHFFDMSKGFGAELKKG